MKHASPRRPRPRVQVREEEATVDVRAFACQFVAVLLANEGITLTPTQLAEAS
jgi:hypothetical protein